MKILNIKGTYNEAKVFAINQDSKALDQIKELCNNENYKDAKIRVMPDYHAGAGCVIGLTMQVPEGTIIEPNLIGVDIGCGVLGNKICFHDEIISNLDQLDRHIRTNVPSGFNISKNIIPSGEILIKRCRCFKELKNPEKLFRAMGSLGGGNHFIEIGINEKRDAILITVHSGSRNFGLQVAQIYEQKFKNGEKGWFDDYLFDMKIAQKWASENRWAICNIIHDGIFELTGAYYNVHEYESVHNYFDFSDLTVRKGAISAKEDKDVIIPFNMRDGIIVGKGKGIDEWNCSAPHGAGRVLSRSQAKKQVSLEDFKSAMEGVYSTSISESTLDESPFAYKNAEDIKRSIENTVDIESWFKPVYNFKAL